MDGRGLNGPGSKTSWCKAMRPSWIVQRVIPPALLTYFVRVWYLCVTEIGPSYISQQFRRPFVGSLYSAFATFSICTITSLYLRLYFLPKTQSVPPFDPPSSILDGDEIFECVPESDESSVPVSLSYGTSSDLGVKVNRCWKGRCRGRWKPARARHCSDCGTCRAGFDHHCAFFANCLTAPYIPIFILTVLLTGPSVWILSSPLYPSLLDRAAKAFELSRTDSSIQDGWYGWWASWVIAGGPVGRYVAGTYLGWKALDRVDGGGSTRSMRAEIGILVAIGNVLAMITTALAVSTIRLILRGQFTVDRERAKSYARVCAEIDNLMRNGKPVSERLRTNAAQLVDRHFLWVPEADGNGTVIETIPGERPYDLGSRGNWELVMGEGWSWLLPWKAIGREDPVRGYVMNWPINPKVEKRLRDEATRRATTLRRDDMQ